MKRIESTANKYGQLYVKHWKAGNKEKAQYYHDKLHRMCEEEQIRITNAINNKTN